MTDGVSTTTRPEQIPGWRAEEDGGLYYRVEDVEPLLVEREAASPALDVERLAEAMMRVNGSSKRVEEVATEYARLGEPSE